MSIRNRIRLRAGLVLSLIAAVTTDASASAQQRNFGDRRHGQGSLAVAEARVRGHWMPVLAAAMTGGAAGVSVRNADAELLFEFTDADDPDMGRVAATPAIAKFRTAHVNGIAEYKYFVIVAGGPDRSNDDGKEQGRAGALFLLSLDKSPMSKWKLGGNYFKFRTSAMDAVSDCRLSSPALAVDVHGAVRYAYAGDLQGNLWRFDFTGEAPWSEALAGAAPLFVASDVNGVRQPISTTPRVVFAPGGYLVLVGTGRRPMLRDGADGQDPMQSFYGIHDTTDPGYSVAGRSELTPRTLEREGALSYRFSGDALAYGNGSKRSKGWYFDFPASDKTGERTVGDPLVASGMLFFNTLASGGWRSYILTALTGLPPDGTIAGFLLQDGTPDAPVVLETSTETSDRNAIGRRTIRKTYTVSRGESGDEGRGEISSVEIVVPAGRFSWREVPNWQELHDVHAKK